MINSKQKSREFKSLSFKPTCNRYKCISPDKSADQLSNESSSISSSKRAGVVKQNQNGAKPRYVTIIEPPPLFKLSPPPNPLLFLGSENSGFIHRPPSDVLNSDQSSTSNYKRFLMHMLNASSQEKTASSDLETDAARIYDSCNSFRLNFSPSLNQEDDQELKYSIDLLKNEPPRKVAKEKQHYTVEISAKKAPQNLNRLTTTTSSSSVNNNKLLSLNSTSQPATRSSILSNGLVKDSSNLFNLFIFSTISFVVFIALLVFIYVVLTRKHGWSKKRSHASSSPNSTFSSSLNHKYSYEKTRLNKDPVSNNTSLFEQEQQHLLLLNQGSNSSQAQAQAAYKYSNYDTKYSFHKASALNQPVFVPVSLNGHHQVFNPGDIQLGLLTSQMNNHNHGGQATDDSSMPYESVSILNHLNLLAANNNCTSLNNMAANQVTLNRQQHQNSAAMFGLLQPSSVEEFFSNNTNRRPQCQNETSTPRNDVLSLHPSSQQLAASNGGAGAMTRAVLLSDGGFNLCTLANRPSVQSTKPAEHVSASISFREKSQNGGKKGGKHQHKQKDNSGKRTKTLDCKYSDRENKSFLKPLIDDSKPASASTPRTNISLSNESSSSSSFSSYHPSTTTSNVTQNNSNTSVQAIQSHLNLDHPTYAETVNHYQKLFNTKSNSPMGANNYVQMNAQTLSQCTLGNSLNNKVALLCSTEPGSHQIIKVMTLLNNNQIKDIGLFTLPKPCYEGHHRGVLAGNGHQFVNEMSASHNQQQQQSKFDENEEFYELIDDLCINNPTTVNAATKSKPAPASSSSSSASSASEASSSGLVSLRKQKKYPKTNPNYSTNSFLNNNNSNHHHQMQSFGGGNNNNNNNNSNSQQSK